LALGNGLRSLRGKMTILLITNRPSFAAIADRVFTVSDGKFRALLPAPASAANAGQKPLRAPA
jgi:ABC-type protease/lipase transport system fused ATPase/permease subunit